MEIPDSIEEFLPYYDSILLESHGALSWGGDLTTAYYKMESTEFYAELLYKAKALGGPKEFDASTVERLYQLRKEMGLPGKHPVDKCQNKNGSNCHNCGGKISSPAQEVDGDLVASITKKVIEQLGL